MTIEVDIDVTIARPPAIVFVELSEVERFPEWLVASGIVRVERLEDGELGVGSKVRVAQRVGGRSTVLDGTITDFERDRAFGLRGRDGDGVTIEIHATVAADGPGTRLRWSLRIGLPLQYRMFESMVAPQVRRAASLDLEALKRRLESVAGT